MSYRYEELDGKSFQRLCQALLVGQFPHVQCMPVAQRDGGRDAAVRPPGAPRERLVFHVKWTAHPDRRGDPVAWLLATVRAEEPNLIRLVAEGVGR